MCGVAGIYRRQARPASPAVLQRMADSVAHRGPDGEGIFIDGDLGLGHRRLAILDLSPAGHQPMLSADGRYALVYNGEVFNHLELRAELEAANCRFRSRCDAEVVLYALAVWGTSAIERFNGMFALALFDRVERRLLLARDRYGIKPLYHTEVDGDLIFASEIKAFLQCPGFRARLNPRALRQYMVFQNVLDTDVLFEGVSMLPPGTVMEVCREHRRISRYWDFRFEHPSGPTPHRNEVVEEIGRLLHQAVTRQLISDVPVSAYLSGGMDSGSLVAVAAQQVPQLRTFTLGYDRNSSSGIEIAVDERPLAELMSYRFGTEHYEMVLKAGDLERCLPRLVWHLEDLRVGQSYPNLYAAQLASRFGKVVLSGGGGDEIFAGYPWRYYRAAVNSDFEQYVDKYYGFWQRMVDPSTLDMLTNPIAGAAGDLDPRDTFRSVFPEHSAPPACPEDYINHSLYFEAKTFLHGLLVVEDRLSMAHGLETRVPFLDNDLVDFAQRVPVSMKLGNLAEVVRLNENEPGPKTKRYYEQCVDGKMVLREAMSQLVPEEVVQAEKRGFSAPDAAWFRGESIEYVKHRLFARRALLYEFLDFGTVRSLVLDHIEGRTNRRLLIWSLLCLEEWCRVFLDGQHSTA